MSKNSINAGKNLGIRHNVAIRILDVCSGTVVQEHVGHNAATNSMLLGIGHYLLGDGVLNQGSYMLSEFVPKYISLGTMGLSSQACDESGLPTGIGDPSIENEADRFTDYIAHRPGYGADGYSASLNNGRAAFGIGVPFSTRADKIPIDCELITPKYPRTAISFRDVIPESRAELSQTLDVVFSAMISTGALKEFRAPNTDYIFISEVGLWAEPTWTGWDTIPPEWEASGSNGLLAGYRIIPPNDVNWNMNNATNRNILKQSIIRVGINQIVQVIWKLQIGSIDQLGGHSVTPEPDSLNLGRLSVGISIPDRVSDGFYER